MPVTVVVSTPEREALEAAGVKGLDAYKFTYDPKRTLTILRKLPQGDVRDALTQRLAGVASQIGLPNVLFAPAPEPAPQVAQPVAPPTEVPEDSASPSDETVPS